MAKLIGQITYPKDEAFAVEYAKLYSENDGTTLEFRLVNNGQKTVNAYRVDLSYSVNGEEKSQSFQGRNLDLAQGSTTDIITCSLASDVGEGTLTLSAVIYDDLSHSPTEAFYPFASFDAISRKAESMLAGGVPAKAAAQTPKTIATAPVKETARVTTTPKTETVDKIEAKPKEKPNFRPLILAICAFVGLIFFTVSRFIVFAIIGNAGSSTVTVGYIFYITSIITMLLQLGCSIVGLIALLLCQKNPKITIAVSLICALMVSFITYHWNVDVLVLVMAGLLAVFALIALLKRHLALLITSSILIIVVLLIMGLMGGCSISCNSADKDDLPSGYLVLEYCETGNPSERAVIRYHNIEDVTAEEISSGYLPYENGYVDLILPEYTPDGYSVVTISSDTFSNNSSIKSLTVPASVTQIHRAAFSNCNSLKSVYLHGVEFVDMYAFYNCSNLEVITLPSTLQVISDCAFQSCYSLKTVIYEGSEESWNQITIGEDNDMLYNVDIEFLG